MTSPARLPVAIAAGLAIVFGLFAGSPVTARIGGQTKPATGPGSVPTKGPCRTYDTSATSVTNGGGMTVTVQISGVFDPWSLRMVQNVNYSSTGGSRFTYVQTTTWDSAEDFIAEVIRLKPPAGLPTSPSPALVNDIIPPLTRSRNTIATGQIGLRKFNSFDTLNRLTGFNTSTGPYTISVRYSGWDSTGRPTAGTMQGPTATSTISISYDDKALTQTEVTTTQGIVSTMTTTYDRFGNMRGGSSSVTRGASSTTTWTSNSSATVCLLDLRAAPAPPTKPFGPNPNGTFTATIGGQSFKAPTGLKAENASPVMSVGAGDGRYIVSIGVAAKPGPGEYKAGPPENVDFSKMSPDQFKDLMEHNTVVATVFDTQTKQGWQASPTIGSGSVTLTSIAGAATGTFSLTLEPIPNTGASGSLRFNGSFNIKY